MIEHISKAQVGSCHVFVTELTETTMNFFIQINPQDDDVDITGYIKWDGCINWETNNNCMAHFCDKSQVDDLAGSFKWIYDEASEKMLRFDRSVA